MRTRTYIINLRHGSLQMNVSYSCVKSYAWELIIKGDILVQKIKVKTSIFKFSTPLFNYLFIKVYITYIFKDIFILVIQ